MPFLVFIAIFSFIRIWRSLPLWGRILFIIGPWLLCTICGASTTRCFPAEPFLQRSSSVGNNLLSTSLSAISGVP